MSGILRLRGQNFKRLEAIDVETNGKDAVYITGENGQGKSSALDLTWWILNNPGKSKIPQPIRNGAEFASGTVEIKDMLITRTKTYEKDNLEIIPKATGIPTQSPATLLKRLVGDNLDPMDFMNLKEIDQVSTLMNALGLKDELTKLDEKRQEHYDKRKDINRDLKAAKARSAIFVKEVEPVDVSALITKRDEMQKQQRAYEVKSDMLDFDDDELDNVEDEIKEIEEKLSNLKARKETLVEKIRNTKEELAKMPNPDTTEITEKIKNAQTINENAAKYKDYKADKEEAKQLESESEELTTKIGGIDLRKQELIKSAKFPVEGISFEGGSIMLNGAPLKQAGDAEQIKVCIAIAAATIPENGIRIMRIKNGNLLDSKNRAVLDEMADKLNFQPWVEFIDESGKVGIVIENGKVKKNNYEKQFEPELN